MTSCAECLSAMRTTSLAEMGPGSLIANHVATCSRCGSVADELRYAEYRLARALSDQQPGTDATQLTVAAIQGAEVLRRRRIGRRMRAALVVAACAVFFVFMQQRTNPNPTPYDNSPEATAVVTRTIVLKCLRPDQAMAVATPYLRDKAGIWTVPDSRVITLRGRQREIQQAISQIDQLDLACELPNPAAPPAATSPSR